MVELYTRQLHTITAKGVEITMAGARPIDKFDTEFETRLGRPQKFCLIKANQFIEPMNCRNSGFTDAHGSYFFGFEQGNG